MHSVIMLSVVLLSVNVLMVIMLSVVMLSVIVLIVMVPCLFFKRVPIVIYNRNDSGLYYKFIKLP